MLKCKCGAEIGEFEIICDECLEKSRFERAKKINIADYKNSFIYDMKTELYFEEIDILEEYYESEKIELPDYVYACFPIKFSLDLYSIIENELLDNHFEDAFDFVDKEGLKELQKLVDSWTDDQGIVSYDIDYNTVVLLNK